jgi:hypothetical protein
MTRVVTLRTRGAQIAGIIRAARRDLPDVVNRVGVHRAAGQLELTFVTITDQNKLPNRAPGHGAISPMVPLLVL